MTLQTTVVSYATFKNGKNEIVYDWDDVTFRIEGVRLVVIGHPTPLHNVICDHLNPSAVTVRTLTLPNNVSGTFFNTSLPGNNVLLIPFEKDGVTPLDPPRFTVEGGWGVRVRWRRL